MYAIALIASLLASVAVAAPTPTEDVVLEKRQSTTWQDNCRPPSPAPSDFKAFNVGNCEAQLTYSRGKNVGVMWEYDAIYADGSRVNHKPFRDFNNIAVSDPFYTIGYGNNYITNRTQSQAFTSVHEFTNVCRNGATPTAWIFYTTSANSACTSKNYRYTTGRIATQNGRRPAKTSFSGRQINSAGDVEISWTAVSGAQTYNPFIQIPTSQYEDSSGYFVTDRGARVSGATTRAVFPGVIRFRNPDEPRKIYVNVQNSQGIWSHTPSTVPVGVTVQ